MESLLAIGFFLLALGYCLVQIRKADRSFRISYMEIILENLSKTEKQP